MKKDNQFIEMRMEGSLLRIHLNRPDQHNALIPELLLELDQVLDEIASMQELQFVVLSGNGRSFCAGADLNWFSEATKRLPEQNAADYKLLADVLLKLFQLPQITIALARGNVFGGGIGLMSVCDFVLAESTTRFMFSEVKLGLLPATILPFVAKRLSIQYMRKWILTGSLFNAEEANQAGLIDVLTNVGSMETSLQEVIALFDTTSPTAVKKAKGMINMITSGHININATDVTSTILAQTLLSPDGQEGIQAFLESRAPEWRR